LKSSSSFDKIPKLFFMQRMAFVPLCIGLVLIMSSCGGIKGLQYVQGNLDSAAFANVQFKEPLIQRGDIISISFFSDDPLATAAVTNQMPSSVSPASTVMNPGANAPTASNTPTYVVDQQGDIQLYRLGLIHVEGLSKKALADTLAAKYERLGLLKNPFAEVRFLNNRITLVGEVQNPGVYSVPSERVSIFEAVGLAGDITTYGRRDNVLIVREANGVRTFAKLDLTKPNVFLSPYFYLQQNDMVIVDVRNNKSVENDQVTTRNITIAASILSTIAIFINVFRR
jgi:polysaccharide export outer membrane protein